MLRGVWVFTCDVTVYAAQDDARCPARLEIPGGKLRAARFKARKAGWRAADERSYDAWWFCPAHARFAQGPPREEHEGWCPYRTRTGACACKSETATYDDAIYRARHQARAPGGDVRDVHEVRPPGEML